MKVMMLSFLLTVCLTFQASTLGQYEKHFGSGWKWQAVGPHQTTIGGGDSYCQVKAVGWKLLSTRRERTQNTPWYSIGEVYQKWAYRIVVGANPQYGSVTVTHHEVDLKSDDGFVLDRSGESEYLYKLRSLAGSPAVIILGGNEIVLEKTMEYNASKKEGEGKPFQINWSVGCELSEEAKQVLQRKLQQEQQKVQQERIQRARIPTKKLGTYTFHDDSGRYKLTIFDTQVTVEGPDGPATAEYWEVTGMTLGQRYHGIHVSYLADGRWEIWKGWKTGKGLVVLCTQEQRSKLGEAYTMLTRAYDAWKARYPDLVNPDYKQQ